MNADLDPDAAPSADTTAEGHPQPDERPLFQHPQWALGIVLILALAALFAGILGDPVWLLIGSPCIVTLLIYIWVRVVGRP